MHAQQYPHRKKVRKEYIPARANKRIRKGDIVQIIAGKEAASSKTGKVLKIITKTNRCIVEKANMVKVHRKPTQNKPGGIDEKESSIHLSNVKFISRAADTKTGTKTKATAPKAEKTTAKKKAAKK